MDSKAIMQKRSRIAIKVDRFVIGIDKISRCTLTDVYICDISQNKLTTEENCMRVNAEMENKTYIHWQCSPL